MRFAQPHGDTAPTSHFERLTNKNVIEMRPALGQGCVAGK
jgi:hypothetical protein